MIIDLAEERARRLRIRQGAAVRSSTDAMVSHKRIPLPDYAQPEPDRTELIDPAPVPERVEDETEQLEEIVWRTSGRGNPWTCTRAHRDLSKPAHPGRVVPTA